MDQTSSFDIARLCQLNECLCATIEILTRAQRIGLPSTGVGLSHSPFTPNLFGVVPTMAPRAMVEYPGFAHSAYNYGSAYPFYNAVAGWPTQQTALPQTSVDPFLRERVGFTHTPSTPWNITPYAAEIERQRLQALFARQYDPMATVWRPFGI